MKTRALVAEFIGTFALLFVIFNIVHNFERNAGLQLLTVAIGVGLTIAILGTAFGPVSGGHFNPCVTFGMLVAGKIDLMTAILYWVFQCVGALAAVFTAAWLLGTSGETVRLGISVGRGADISLVAAVVAEAVAAFLFVTVIFMTAVDRRAPANGALYLGGALTIGILSIGTISGGAINPAVGLALSFGSGRWENVASWLAGPLIGAGLAALAYKGMWAKDEAATV
jgi:glycerol uptake facilitator-like aquaporin